MTIENKNFTTVDIMIACHNRSKDIEKLINHFYKIECPTNIIFSIQIVDDCSSDNSVEVIKSLQKKYSTLYLIENKENKGTFYNRYLLLNESNADYIFFIDDDDDISDNLLTEFAKHLNCDLIKTIQVIVEKGKSYIPYESVYSQLETVEDMLTLVPAYYITGIFISKYVYKQMVNVIKQLDCDFLHLTIYEDQPYFYLMVTFARNFAITNAYYYYLMNSTSSLKGSASERHVDNGIRNWEMIWKIISILQENNLYHLSPNPLLFSLWNLIYFKDKKNKENKFLYKEFKKINLEQIKKSNSKNKIKCLLFSNPILFWITSYFIKPFLKQ